MILIGYEIHTVIFSKSWDSSLFFDKIGTAFICIFVLFCIFVSMKEQDEDINNELEKLKAEAYSLRKRVSELMTERARLQTIYKAQQSEIQALREREQQRRQD